MYIRWIIRRIFVNNKFIKIRYGFGEQAEILIIIMFVKG